MSGHSYIQHGRRHRPGGSDPIPQIASLGAAPFQILPIFTTTAGAYAQHWSDRVVDETIFGGAVLRNTTGGGPTNGDYVAFHAALGPFGSVWAVDLVLEFGTDYGIVVVEYASITDESFYDPTELGVMQDPSTATYIGPAGANVDAYGIAGTPNNFFEGLGIFRIMGSPGAPLTAFGTDAYTGFASGDGGPGLYNIRLKVSGKNASSSGYKAGVQFAAIRRIAEGFV